MNKQFKFLAVASVLAVLVPSSALACVLPLFLCILLNFDPSTNQGQLLLPATTFAVSASPQGARCGTAFYLPAGLIPQSVTVVDENMVPLPGFSEFIPDNRFRRQLSAGVQRSAGTSYSGVWSNPDRNKTAVRAFAGRVVDDVPGNQPVGILVNFIIEGASRPLTKQNVANVLATGGSLAAGKLDANGTLDEHLAIGTIRSVEHKGTLISETGE